MLLRARGSGPKLKKLGGIRDDGAVAGGAEVFEHAGKGGDAHFAAEGRAFVEEDDCAGAEAAGDLGGDRGGTAGKGVAAADGPPDADEAARGERAGEKEIFDADRRAEAGGQKGYAKIHIEFGGEAGG
jgi:hypothetical protein